jgi:phage-related protein
MKPVVWLGDSKRAIREFPEEVQGSLGHELARVQWGRKPLDHKPMPSIGAEVEEIRAWAESGTYRVLYIARLAEAVYVLHAFQKKTQQTSQRDVDLAQLRLRGLLRELLQSKSRL